MTDLKVDPSRLGNNCNIPIRAVFEDRFAAYDFAELDRESVIAWMNDNEDRLKSFILVILGHGQ